MKCPVCENEMEDRFCKKCNKFLENIYVEIFHGDKTKAVEKLRLEYKIAVNEEDKNNLRRAMRNIMYERINIILDLKRETQKFKSYIRELDFYKCTKLALFTFSILIFFIFIGSIVNKIFEEIESSFIMPEINTERKLKIALVFNVNLEMSEITDIAYRESYKRVFEAMSKVKKLKINLAISGGTIETLKWYAPDLLQDIKKGINNNQIEIVGSTYSGAILSSLNECSKKWQLNEGASVQKDTFGINSLGFFNEETVMDDNILELLAKENYKYSFISKEKEENCCFKKNGIILFNENNKIEELFNKVLSAGMYEDKIEDKDRARKLAIISVKKYILNQFKKNRKDNEVIVYKGNINHLGLFYSIKPFETYEEFERFKNGNIRDAEYTLDSFVELANSLCEIKWIEFSKLTDTLGSINSNNIENVKGNNTTIQNAAKYRYPKGNSGGKATWFDTAHFSESSFKDWNDFNINSTKINYYRKLYRKYEEQLEKYSNNPKDNINKLYQLGVRCIIAHQYRFGVPHIAGNPIDWEDKKRFTLYENVRSTAVLIRAIKNIEENFSGIRTHDVNDDGIEEIEVVNNKNMYIFSKERGGRLLYWIDLENGIELAGNEDSVHIQEQYVNDNDSPIPITIGAWDVFMNNENNKYFKNKRYFARNRIFNDIFTFGEGFYKTKLELHNSVMNTQIITNEGKIVFNCDNILKVITFSKIGIRVDYKILEKSNYTMLSEITPDYLTVLKKGFNTLSVLRDKEQIRIENNVSNTRVTMNYFGFSEVDVIDSLFGKVIEMKGKHDNPWIELKND